MTLEIWLLYIGTILLFMSTPGPSHLLMISVSMSNGFKRSLATAAGDLAANAIQIALAGFGLAAIVMSSRYGFAVVKWLGVAYLAWIGIKTIIASFNGQNRASAIPQASLSSLWLRGFITSAANPKAVVFFAALFPQFIDSQQPLLTQILILGSTYIVVDGMFLATYGKGASWIAQKISEHSKNWIERVSGFGLVVTAILLGLRSNSQE
ncbi:MAG: LysE family transporter [Pseudomonadales bacterium]|nr:LysE family transporter [Pseudomonadales bacterium]